MNDKELAELLKYSSPKELYVVAYNNLLKLLVCPFKVVVLNDVGSLKANKIAWVEQVKITRTLKTVFIIESKAYFYFHFEIIVN